MRFSSQSWSSRGNCSTSFTDNKDPPSSPAARTNRNSPLIQHWPSVTLQWGIRVPFQVLLIKILFFPGSEKLNWAPVETEVEFHLSSLC